MLKNLHKIEMRRGTEPEFSKEQLVMTGFDLFGGGAETTSTSLCWALQYLALNPAAQHRCWQVCHARLSSAQVS